MFMFYVTDEMIKSVGGDLYGEVEVSLLAQHKAF